MKSPSQPLKNAGYFSRTEKVKHICQKNEVPFAWNNPRLAKLLYDIYLWGYEDAIIKMTSYEKKVIKNEKKK